jgi:hypothetical protein
MMLGFKSQFAAFVEEGSKTHTIRAKSKREWKPGMRCDCYVNARQKSMRLLGRFECTAVDDIWLVLTRDVGRRRLSIIINGVCLDPDEAEQFAWRDGFRPANTSVPPLQLMAAFWALVHSRAIFKGKNPNWRKATFHGDLIHWRFVSKEEHER